MKNLYVFPTIETHSNKLEEAYEVAEDFSAEFQGKEIWVPKFFQYDGASIPSAAYHIVGTPFNPRFMKAAVVHDWLYHTHELNRGQADKLFYKMLRDAGVNKVTAILMREAVENFGGWYWDNDDDDIEYKNYLIEKIAHDNRDPKKYGLEA